MKSVILSTIFIVGAMSFACSDSENKNVPAPSASPVAGTPLPNLATPTPSPKVSPKPTPKASPKSSVADV